MFDKVKAWLKAEGLGVQIAFGILSVVGLLIIVSVVRGLFS